MKKADLPGERIRLRLRVGVEGSEEIEGFAAEEAENVSSIRQTETAALTTAASQGSLQGLEHDGSQRAVLKRPSSRRVSQGGVDIDAGDSSGTEKGHSDSGTDTDDDAEIDVHTYVDDTQ